MKPSDHKRKISLLPLIGLLGIVILATVIIHTCMTVKVYRTVRQTAVNPEGNEEAVLFSEELIRTGTPSGQPDLALLLQDAVQRWRRGDRKNAGSIFRTVLVFQPDNFTALSYAGTLAFQEEKYPEAEFFFREQIRHHPDLPGGYANLGMLHLHQNQLEQALKNFQRAGQLDPHSFKAAINLAGIYAYTGNIRSALLHLKRAAETDPESTLKSLKDPLLESLRTTPEYREIREKALRSAGKEARL